MTNKEIESGKFQWLKATHLSGGIFYKSLCHVLLRGEKAHALPVPKHIFLGTGWGQALVNIMLLRGIFGLLEPKIKPETRIFIYFLEKNKK